MSFCLPVWFSNEAGRRVYGSMTVIETSEAMLGITAGHVADRIIECCEDKGSRQCQIDRLCFLLIVLSLDITILT